MEKLESYELNIEGINYSIDGFIYENEDESMGEIELTKVEVPDLNNDEEFIKVTDPMTLEIIKELIRIEFADQFRDKDQDDFNSYLDKLWNER